MCPTIGMKEQWSCSQSFLSRSHQFPIWGWFFRLCLPPHLPAPLRDHTARASHCSICRRPTRPQVSFDIVIKLVKDASRDTPLSACTPPPTSLIVFRLFSLSASLTHQPIQPQCFSFAPTPFYPTHFVIAFNQVYQIKPFDNSLGFTLFI